MLLYNTTKIDRLQDFSQSSETICNYCQTKLAIKSLCLYILLREVGVFGLSMKYYMNFLCIGLLFKCFFAIIIIIILKDGGFVYYAFVFE